MKMDIGETITQHLLATLSTKLQGIVMYGSEAQGTAGKDSDIDVGVLLDGTMTANKLWQLAQDLAVKLMRDVDLVDLRRASTVLQKEIIVNGQWLLRTDKLACDLFDTHVISMYQDLQHNRRYLLKDLKHRIYHG